MLAVVVSRADSASEHIADRLLDAAEWDERVDAARPDADGGGTYYRRDGLELRTFDDRHLDLERPAEAFSDPGPDVLVFASRHSGETGPLLTAHFTGNFGPADYGGDPGAFARACPAAQRRVLDELRARAPEGYDVGIECTHHGPTDVGAPSMFVELGSGEDEWADPAGARAVAAAILALGEADVAPDDPDGRQLVGLGGGHYAPRFERVLRETDWSVGHVASDWQLDAMGSPASNADVLRRAFEASAAEHAVVDGADADDLRTAVERLGRRVVSETWVRETDGTPLWLVESLESALSRVDDGLRLGEASDAVGGEDAFDVVSLPDELVDEALGVDADAARAAVAERTVAYETTESGTRPRGRAAVADPGDVDAVVDALAAVLAEKYESVERDGDAVVVREVTFDPEKARTLGVSEGPSFGRLASGEAVEVNGRRIPPEEVRTERTRRFPV